MMKYIDDRGIENIEVYFCQLKEWTCMGDSVDVTQWRKF
jgi:hypothetical protein